MFSDRPDEEVLSLSLLRYCRGMAQAQVSAAFVAKLSDPEGEAAETQVWLDFSLFHRYIDKATYKRLDEQYEYVLGMLVRMSDRPEQWVIRPSNARSDSPVHSRR